MGAYTIAVTGASGSVYGLRLLQCLLAGEHSVTFVATKMGAEVMAYETGLDLPATGARETLLERLALPDEVGLRVVAEDDMFDAIASGSHRDDGMVVAPCSVGFAGKVASGSADDLPARAADVCLKERRRLVMVVRETPLSLVHLRTLTLLAEAGAVILPAMPGFYHKPENVGDLVDYVIGKVFDSLDIDHRLFPRWGEGDEE